MNELKTGRDEVKAPYPAAAKFEDGHTDHPDKLRTEINDLILHLRADISRVVDPKTQVLFEVSAEVLTGLVRAFNNHQSRTEPVSETESHGARIIAPTPPIAATPSDPGAAKVS